MKKFRNLLLALLSVACVGTAAAGFAGCNGDGELNNSSQNSSVTTEKSEMEQIYAQYVVYAQAEGVTPLSYEEWLATIKGEKGEKGDQGEQGEHGKDGVGVESVTYDKDGNLVITFTDGTTQIVEVPNNTSEQVESLHFQKIDGKEEYRVVGLGNVSDLDIVIPDTYRGLPVTEIGNEAFRSAVKNRIIKTITIPDSVTKIGKDAFIYCKDLTSVVIGNGVTTIGGGAFSSCSSLTSVVIPDSVTSIGAFAFEECDNLESVVIGNGVTMIDDYAFMCLSLTSIAFEGTVEEWNAISKGENWNKHVPATEVVCSDGTVTL